MTYLGGATFAWQSDYSQVYLVDANDPLFEAPVDITAEMMQRRWHPMATGLVVYTNASLYELLDIQIHSVEPATAATDWRSNRPWTQVETTRAVFPSKQFTVSSPSKSGTEAYGPMFCVDSRTMAIRISWMEYPPPRYDTPAEHDVIFLQLWPVV